MLVGGLQRAWPSHLQASGWFFARGRFCWWCLFNLGWTIPRGHALTKVSDPYSKAGLPLKIPILVCTVSSLQLPMSFNCKATNLALPILALTRRLLFPSPPSPPDCVLHCPDKWRHPPLPKGRFSTELARRSLCEPWGPYNLGRTPCAFDSLKTDCFTV